MKKQFLTLAILATPLVANADNEAVGTPLTAPPEIAAVFAGSAGTAQTAEAYDVSPAELDRAIATFTNGMPGDSAQWAVALKKSFTAFEANHPHTFGAALGAFLFNNYLVYHDLPLDDAADAGMKSVIAQYDRLVREHPEDYAAADKEKYINMIMAGSYAAMVLHGHHQDKSLAGQYAFLKSAAGSALENYFKVPVDRVVLENGQLIAR